MADTPKRLLCCSFCGKDEKSVRKLIAGPDCFICNECVDICRELVEPEAVLRERLVLEAWKAGFDCEEAQAAAEWIRAAPEPPEPPIAPKEPPHA